VTGNGTEKEGGGENFLKIRRTTKRAGIKSRGAGRGGRRVRSMGGACGKQSGDDGCGREQCDFRSRAYRDSSAASEGDRAVKRVAH